jgi:hypothetical protein
MKQQSMQQVSAVGHPCQRGGPFTQETPELMINQGGKKHPDRQN